MHDTAWSQGDVLLASVADKASALLCRIGFEDETNGYYDTGEGIAELKKASQLAKALGPRVTGRASLINRYSRAADGNVVQVARIRNPRAFTLALGFGREADE